MQHLYGYFSVQLTICLMLVGQHNNNMHIGSAQYFLLDTKRVVHRGSILLLFSWKNDLQSKLMWLKNPGAVQYIKLRSLDWDLTNSLNFTIFSDSRVFHWKNSIRGLKLHLREFHLQSVARFIFDFEFEINLNLNSNHSKLNWVDGGWNISTVAQSNFLTEGSFHKILKYRGVFLNPLPLSMNQS
jgi:hypothetical protein